MNEKSKVREIQETNLGVYIWRMNDGSWLIDGDGNFLSITAFQGDLTAIAKISAAARNIGYSEGQAIFAPGRRKISDSEFEEQMARQEAGLIPDIYDIGVYKEGIRK